MSSRHNDRHWLGCFSPRTPAIWMMQYHSQQPTASKNLVPISGVLFSNNFSQLPHSTRAQKQQPGPFYPQPPFLLRIRALSVLLLRCPDTTKVETANLILISCPSLMLTCFAGGGPICIYTPGGYIQISVLLHRMSEEAAVHRTDNAKKSIKIGIVSITIILKHFFSLSRLFIA